MFENENLKKVILWLTSQGIIESQEDLAKKLGYNPSSISQIVTGKKRISKKFAKKISELSEKINIDYLLGTSDEMIKDIVSKNSPKSTTIPKNSFEISDLIKVMDNISEAVLKGADSDAIRSETEKIREETEKIRAETDKIRAETEDRHSRNMERLINLLEIEKQDRKMNENHIFSIPSMGKIVDNGAE